MVNQSRYNKTKLFWINKNQRTKLYSAFYRDKKGFVIKQAGFYLRLQAKRYLRKMILKEYFGEE